jgi:hypothetical protein
MELAKGDRISFLRIASKNKPGTFVGLSVEMYSDQKESGA